MISPDEAADEPSPGDPSSRLGESLKQFELANQEIGSNVAEFFHQIALELAWIERHLDVETTAVCYNRNAVVSVMFDDGTTPAEAKSTLEAVADPDSIEPDPAADGVTVKLLYGEDVETTPVGVSPDGA
ncbi:hypothetical protein SAMN05192561_11235 [Halopenitus malekzadehii]|uniref:Uncharacterized protein n=1 Tax=Halopenitus malekzadehii TaxID=1267564 RepID=A0A1H6JIV0_9EURY|nr:hypothetical protein [Halopenitus malekzadehii]SEH60748.1 hypothetical protein SAMN05192561_11235 [Halopenitus malekzadehii]